MPRTRRRRMWVAFGLLVLLARPADAHPPARAGETPGLLASQVTIVVERGNSRRQFQATVMAVSPSNEGAARGETVLTILTAAHCIGPDDATGPALLLRDRRTIEGTVELVRRNPSYQPNQPREVPGPDNAVARIRFRVEPGPSADALTAIRPAAGLTAQTYPPPSGQTVAIRVIDGHGVEHAVRAGNYTNPRWLEWGPSYQPIPGDSGAGVFILHAGADGQPRPILIGVLVGRDDKGGGASLVAREMRWIAEELR